MINFSPIVNPGDVIAVGDIHGRADLFNLFLEHVKDTGARVILLGDLIDRGPDDVAVLETSKKILDDPESYGLESFSILQGNHERMMEEAEDGWFGSIMEWYRNGGNDSKKEEIFKHAEWIRKLPVFMVVGETLFTHAGVFPGRNPEDSIADGKTTSLLWMREPFLTHGPLLEEWTPIIKRVVHGHTPTPFEPGSMQSEEQPLPIVQDQRVNIDTLAYKSGVLTSFNSTSNTFWQYHLDEEKAPAG